MRNTSISGNSILERALGVLRDRLPGSWRVTVSEREPRGATNRPDALVEVRAADGTRAVIAVEAKRGATAVYAAGRGPQLRAAAEANRAGGSLLVTTYLTPLARQRLQEAGISYLDLTGNIRISLDRPGLFIESRGADRDPAPPQRDSRSLKGASAARIVRALCDWRPPVGVRELARRAGTDPGYATRILTLLEREDVIGRDRKGGVAVIQWKDLLKRWARDYAVARTNRVVSFLEPRGLDALIKRLRGFQGQWAITGSRAVPAAAAVATATRLSFYVKSIEQAAGALQLRDAEAGANVFLIEPFDTVIWERSRAQEGLSCVAVSQCAVDLLTGTGREPSEAEALISWMENNEDTWRA